MAWLVIRPTMMSGREAWYTVEETTTAGRRFTPVTPGKSMTTTSPGSNKFLVLRVEAGRIFQREGDEVTLVLIVPIVATIHHSQS